MNPCPDCRTEDDEHPLWCPQARRDAREREALRPYPRRSWSTSTPPPIMEKAEPNEEE